MTETIKKDDMKTVNVFDKYGNNPRNETSVDGKSMLKSNEYTEDGNYPKSSTDSLGFKTSYSYDLNTGYLNSITDAEGNSVNYSYNNSGQIQKVSQGTVIENSFSYDSGDRLSKITHNDFDYDKIIKRVKKGKVKLIEIQRSRGYSHRKSLSIAKIEKVCREIRRVNKDVIIMVDNCYGDLVEEKEPTQVGADIIVGSLMKNLGGGIAKSGGYMVGKKQLIEDIAEHFSAPGTGKALGANFNENITYFKGLFFAPRAVCSSLKTMTFASLILEKLGFDVDPKFNEPRTDIIQTINLFNEENMIKFHIGVQKGSPIDSFVTPVAAPMAGYPHDEIMASGTFTQGSTIELSCDGPMDKPYTAYMQGGLTYEYGKLGILLALNEILKNKK